MGTVYLSHTRGGQPVALKLIRHEYGEDASFRRRFGQEVAAAHRVRGYHLVPVVDFDTEAERPWVATEFVPGLALDEALAHFGPLPLPAVFQMVGCAAQALSAIHAAGVVHRDVKPSNLMLASSGPYVIDFGIARAAGSPELTTTGRIGTPQYMSPEHALGQKVGPASDVFSLGLVAAVAATGRHPYGDGDAIALASRIAGTCDRPPELSGYPAPLRALLGRCLVASAEERITPAEIIGVCERSAGRALRDVEGWLPPPLAEAVTHRARNVPGPGAPTAVAAPQAGPPSPRSVAEARTTTAPDAPAPGRGGPGPGPRGNDGRGSDQASHPRQGDGTPPVRPAARRFPRWAVAVTATIAAVGLALLLFSTLADRFLADDSRAQGPDSSASNSADSAERQDTDSGASASATPESTKPRYVPLTKDEPFKLSAPDYNEVTADLDGPRVVSDGSSYAKSEFVVTTASTPKGWHFSTQTGITTAKTPEACLQSSQTNALPGTLDFEDFEEVAPVGTLLCTRTTEGNIAMVEITDLSPGRTRFGGLDISTRVTVWEQR